MILDLGWTLNPMTSFLIRERRGRFEIQREEAHVKTEAETRVTLPQAKECLSHQKQEDAGKDSPLVPLEGEWLTLKILDFWVPKSTSINFCLRQFVAISCSSHKKLVHLYSICLLNLFLS